MREATAEARIALRQGWLVLQSIALPPARFPCRETLAAAQIKAGAKA